ncbi:hypothetical protein HanIR_Chr04g0160921 [Helianthus annuus]|nr:hypothetical protein HanIR_Chr04g0160921 [Helianthus annuus]
MGKLKILKSNLCEFSIDQAFTIRTLSRRSILNRKHLIFIPQQQNGLTILNNHSPFTFRQRRQRHHRHPVAPVFTHTGRRHLCCFAHNLISPDCKSYRLWMVVVVVGWWCWEVPAVVGDVGGREEA